MRAALAVQLTDNYAVRGVLSNNVLQIQWEIVLKYNSLNRNGVPNQPQVSSVLSTDRAYMFAIALTFMYQHITITNNILVILQQIDFAIQLSMLEEAFLLLLLFQSITQQCKEIPVFLE
jgi:hypothetical protein